MCVPDMYSINCTILCAPFHLGYSLFREVILDLYRAEGPTAKLKRAIILEAAKLKLGNEEVPSTDLNKVLLPVIPRNRMIKTLSNYVFLVKYHILDDNIVFFCSS